ncbi:PTS sugar transporter subunit IIA [Anaerorhabdus sp.]|uniref:PTS sugar transporter subunit IIA n=1 Tax=Anaerorhabdus sp. TaxID=1872524 RepID=UPI002FC7DAF6
MVQVILLSHGPLASAMLDSCAMLFGRKENFSAVCLHEDDTADTFKEKIILEIEKSIDKKEVILITDIPGGTPSNMSLLVQKSYPEIHILAGMNLPLVLECMIKSDFENATSIVNAILETGKEAIQELIFKDEESNDLDDLM